MSEPNGTERRDNQPAPKFLTWACVLLVWLIVGGCLRSVLQHGFLEYDDPLVVTENEFVQEGLTWDGIRWALTTGHFANWMPMTWFTHQLDWQLFGPNPAGHHATNLLLHLIGATFLFLTLREITGHLLLSVAATLLWAIHPLHVESVAWIAERKGVLSTALGMIAWWCFVKQLASWQHRPAAKLTLLNPWFFAMSFFLVGSLLSKQMWVSFPFMMLLTSLWWYRSRRLFISTTDQNLAEGVSVQYPNTEVTVPKGRLLGQIVMIMLLCLTFMVIAMRAQSGGQAVASLDEVPISDRVPNVLRNVIAYLRAFFWPSELQAFYPYPMDPSPSDTGRRLAGLGAIIAIVVLSARFNHAVWMGILWYLITLQPVIGWVVVGRHGSADRYTDVPNIGLCIACVFGIHELLQRLRVSKQLVPVWLSILALWIGLLGWHASIRAPQWKNNATLFQADLQINPYNYFALNQLGVIAQQRGDLESALKHYEESARIDPSYIVAQQNLGDLYLKQGRLAEAVSAFRMVVEFDPSQERAHEQLAEHLPSDAAAEAAQHIMWLINQHGPQPRWLELLGDRSSTLKQFLAARKHFTAVLERQPNDRLRMKLARLLLAAPDDKVRDSKLAEQVIQPIADRMARDPELQEINIMLLIEQGKFEPAKQLVDELLRQTPAEHEHRSRREDLAKAVAQKQPYRQEAW